MISSESLRQVYSRKREILRRDSKDSLYNFIHYNKKDYEAAWHHKLIADKLDEFWKDSTKKKLMLFVPPQHGKSEIASRNFPAWVLGRNPNTKIAAASYALDLSKTFNRDVQRIIDTQEYHNIFPDTRINSRRVTTDTRGYIRNTQEFEIINKTGSYKAVGIQGGLSGRPVDLAIIDDPVKDSIEAGSPVYRQRVWDWYISVLLPRLHNRSKVVLIMTRWHEDDLAGRLLDKEPNEWDVIKIPAIFEVNGNSCSDDSREAGEALWPERHSLEKLLGLRALGESTFQSLYQQNPTTPEGNKIKRSWFEYCHEKEIPTDINWDMWIDGAYTDNTKNDPTGYMIAGFSPSMNKMYIKHAVSSWHTMPMCLKFIPEYAEAHRLGNKSRIYIEPKASGKSTKQMINNTEVELSAVEIKSKLVSEGKEARCNVMSPKIESGRVVLVKGNWNGLIEDELCGYPNATHDEYIDLGGYACDKYFLKKKKKRRGIRHVNG